MILTERDLEELSIDKFIAHCIKLDSFDMLIMIKNFRVFVQGLKADIEPNEIVADFARFIFSLENIVTKKLEIQKPIEMSEENFFKVTPIIEKLVIAGYLEKTG